MHFSQNDKCKTNHILTHNLVYITNLYRHDRSTMSQKAKFLPCGYPSNNYVVSITLNKETFMCVCHLSVLHIKSINLILNSQKRYANVRLLSFLVICNLVYLGNNSKSKTISAFSFHFYHIFEFVCLLLLPLAITHGTYYIKTIVLTFILLEEYLSKHRLFLKKIQYNCTNSNRDLLNKLILNIF